MTEAKPTLERGAEYVVQYAGGPSDGQSDHRISTDGSWDDSLTVLAAEAGNEVLITYDATSWREIGGVYYVTYSYDASESEALEDPEDRD